MHTVDRVCWFAVMCLAFGCGGPAPAAESSASAATPDSGTSTSSSSSAGGVGAAPAAVGGGAGSVSAGSRSIPTGGTVAAQGTQAGRAGVAGTAEPAGQGATAGTSAGAGQGAAGAGTRAQAGQSAGAPASPTTRPWQWPIGKPEDFGVQSAWLDDAANAIQRSTGNRYGMVVVRKGTLIYEKYWQGTADDKYIIYSCTKSWGSSLIGMAVTQGLLTLKDEVRKWVPMPAQGVSEGALLEHVLTQSSHTRPPGQSFMYNSGYLLNTAPEVLGAATGMTPHAFYERNLVEPLGLTMTWPECPKGGCAGTRYAEGFIQFGNQPPEAPNAELPMSTVRDQAKLGWLWANNGMWEGKQLIDPAYIAAGSKPGAGFRSMYGYLMWIENAEQFGAIGGVGNCYVNVMPSKQLVIAVMGNDAGLGQGGGWSSFQSLVNRIQD